MNSETESRAWHAVDTKTVLGAAGGSASGLSSVEAARRLAEDGPNVLESAARAGRLAILARQFESVLIRILFVAAIIAAITGELGDAIAIFAIVLLNAFIGYWQEYRAETALAALRRMTAPKARVIRDGASTIVAAESVVRGDLIELEAGDLVPADARLIETWSLATNEASLTGESAPVEKSTDVLPGKTALAERSNMAFLGASVAAGRGVAIVVATGMRSEIGRIAALLSSASAPRATPLQSRLEALGRILSFAALGVVGVVFALGLLRGIPVLDMFLAAVSLAVAAVPEGLPAVVTIALAVGVQQMARRRALVRRLHAVETLGATNVVCSDKTGTLTVGEMTVRAAAISRCELEFSGEGYSPEGKVTAGGTEPGAGDISGARSLFETFSAANGARIGRDENRWTVIGDPTEGALLAAAAKLGVERAAIDVAQPVCAEFPFDSDRKRMTSVRRIAPDRIRIHVKGAPDALIGRCTTIVEDGRERSMTVEDRIEIESAVARMAARALRVLAAARRDACGSDIPGSAGEAERGLAFLGLAGMQDPPRPEARAAVARCHDAGIRVVMITGDHPVTAAAIASELGVVDARDGRAMSGMEIEALDDAALADAIDGVRVFARVTAEHKLRIVRAFQSRGDVVAMTGDGVNDAPALKGADVGIAMGITGTEVTKEAAAMVVSDDRFETIVDAIEQGRGIYDNIKKTLQYLLAGNTGEILIMAVAVIAGAPIPLLPIQLLWINLVTDGLPALCLAVDPTDPDVMRRRPRGRGERLTDPAFVARLVVTGVLTAGVSLTAYFWALREYGVEMARSHAFGVLVVSELLRAFGCRSETRTILEIGLRSNMRLALVVFASLAVQILIQGTGILEDLFGIPPMPWAHTAVLFLFGAVPMLTLEAIKVATRYRRSP